MLILKPVDTAQAIYTRVKPHELTVYLVAINNAFGVDLYVVSLTYDKDEGVINGTITLPLASKPEADKKNFRIFSADGNNATIEQIRVSGGTSYNMETWGEVLNTLFTDGGIELEIFRGSTLVTSQTDLDKFKLYGI